MKKMFTIFIISMCALAITNACTNGDSRLFDVVTRSAFDKGMLQMCNSYGQWTAVCDYDWTQHHSIVACKQLGYSNPNPITRVNAGEWVRFGFGPYSSCSSSYSSLSECSSYSSSFRTNPSYCNKKKDTVELQCYVNTTSDCTYGDIRLYNSINESTVSDNGMLQICDNAEWTAVCDYNWQCNHAVVACKQLGFSNPKPLYFTNNGSWPIFGFGPYSYCNPSYSSLFKCSSYSSSYKTRINYCDSISDTVSLYCSPLPDNRSCERNFDVRLIGGNDTSEGIVEICHGGVWNSFCSLYNFDNRLAATICYQLGYRKSEYASASIFEDGRFGRTFDIQYIKYNYHCSSPYQQLQRCSFSQPNCGLHCGSSYHHISLKCYEPGNCNEGDIRLVNGTVEREGRLEICAQGVWGAICPSFSRSSAYIACKQLGYDDTNGAIISSQSIYGDGNGPLVYANFDCFGHESTLADCTKSQYPNTYCTRRDVIGLLCYNDCEEGDVRLAGSGHHFEGYVEICLDKMWGLISQSGWNDNDAKVVCMQLGYSGNTTLAAFNSSVSKPRRAVHYSNVNCHGTESKLWDCKHHRYYYVTGQPSVTYDNTEVAAVNCQSDYRPSTSVNPTVESSQEQAVNGVLVSSIVFLIISIIVMLIGILAVVIVSLKMKKMSKLIKKYLAGDNPMNISTHKGHDSQSYQRPSAHTQENSSVYYDLK